MLLAACVLLLLTAGPALAGTLEDLAADLQPVSGYVVLPVQGEFLIDLDASQGVAVGDLFSVVQPGEKITHPVTGAVLGTLDVRKGLLQVTQVKAGYSQARAIGSAGKIARGDQIRRFENLRASFWDYTGKGEAFFARVKEALPALTWQDYASAQAAKPSQPAASATAGYDLLLILDGSQLTVRDGIFDILHAYPAPAEMQAAVSAPLQLAAPYKLEAAPQPLSVSGVRYEATFPGFKSLGALGFPAVMADFLDADGRLLLAATDGKTIKLLEVGEAAVPLTEVMPSDLAQVLSLHWWQPSADQACLAVSGWRDNKLSSSLYLFADGRLTLVEENQGYMFGSFDRDGDGRRELLLAQGFDRDTVWGTLIKEGRLSGRKFSLQDLSIKLPRRFTVSGSLMADLTSDGKPETVFVRDGLLYIFAGTKQLYKSPKMMGGTLSRFLYDEQPHARETETNFAAFEVPPVAADLDGDGRLELLAIASDTGLMAAPGISPGVKKSWLAVLKKRDGMFVKGTLGEELEVPLQGLAVAGDRVLFVATESGTIFGEGGESQVLVFPLVR
jgi:hypothetical protein